ncbi:hypothetical protein K1719_026996 [Acacia pycnantha]|nr:hypothetical protein K1719_026996 [Acacia pycnantha]
MVLKNDVVGTIKRMEKAKAAVLANGVDTSARETKGIVLIHSAEQNSGLRMQCWAKCNGDHIFSLRGTCIRKYRSWHLALTWKGFVSHFLFCLHASLGFVVSLETLYWDQVGSESELRIYAVSCPKSGLIIIFYVQIIMTRTAGGPRRDHPAGMDED